MYIARVRHLVSACHYVTKFVIHTGHIGQIYIGVHNGLDM